MLGRRSRLPKILRGAFRASRGLAVIALAAPLAWASAARAQDRQPRPGASPTAGAPAGAPPPPGDGASRTRTRETCSLRAHRAADHRPADEQRDDSSLQDPQTVSLQGDQRPPGDVNGEFGAKPSDVYSEDWWGTRGQWSSSTATSVRAASSFTISRSADTTRPRPERTRLLAAAARQQLHERDDGNASNVRPLRVYPTATASGQLQRQVRGEREHAVPHEPGAPHLRQPADRLGDRRARQRRARLDTELVRHHAASKSGGLRVAGYNGYAPLGFFSTTQGPPTAGVNGVRELDQREARVGRVHDPRRPAPLRPHAGPVGPRDGRTTPATASTPTGSRRSTASCS